MGSYEVMADVYDRWMARERTPYIQWCAYIERQFDDAEVQVQEVLDLGCGTGSIARLLQSSGYRVTGIDPSRRMLARARLKLEPGTRLLCAAMPHIPRSLIGRFQGVVSCFDVVNYLRSTDELRLSGHDRR